MRKPKGELFNLPLEQRAALAGWLIDEVPALTYARARERLKQEFEVEVGQSALIAFYQWHMEERLLQGVAERAQSTHAIAAEANRNHAQTFEALLELGGQGAYDLKVQPGMATLKELKDYVEMAVRGMRARNAAGFLRVKQREIALMERKYNDKSGKTQGVTGEEMEIIAARLRI